MDNDRELRGAWLIVGFLAAVLVLGGCVSVDSEDFYGPKGPAVGRETLKQIETGRTTRQWLVATLGEPSSESEMPDGTEIVKYNYVKTTDNSVKIFPVLDIENKKQQHLTLCFELENGVVVKFWKEQ